VLWLAGCAGVAQESPAQPAPTPIDLVQLDDLLPLDAIPSIDDPQFDRAEAAVDMRPDERVIGLVIGEDTRAYPLAILSSHEIVNDVVGGEPVAVTWCPLCYTALVFSRDIGGVGKPLTFGVSGKLLRNTLVMFDRESGSLWSQLYGVAIDGELTGTELSFYPSTLTDWSTWRSAYPDSLVLSKAQTRIQFNRPGYAIAPRGSYDVDAYVGYYAAPDEGVVNRNIPRSDESLRPKQKVLGVRVNGSARAYPFALLQRQPVVNDQLGGVPILVWFDVASQTPRAFDRRLDDRVLTFEATDNPLLLRDVETGSTWQMLDGMTIDGPLQDERLVPVIATTAFEFGWYGYFPESEVFGVGE
jgi:hypothetical protein